MSCIKVTRQRNCMAIWVHEEITYTIINTDKQKEMANSVYMDSSTPKKKYYTEIFS